MGRSTVQLALLWIFVFTGKNVGAGFPEDFLGILHLVVWEKYCQQEVSFSGRAQRYGAKQSQDVPCLIGSIPDGSFFRDPENNLL